VTTPDPLAAFCNARLDVEQHSAESMEHFTVFEQPYYSCAGSRTEPHGDLEWGEEHCDCFLAERKAKRLREIAVLRSVVADCEKALRYPANVPLCNLARRTLAGIASIWDGHPDYATAAQP
jgi:hypothetical protein